MATRPDRHITGSKAVHHIQDALLPEEWISNETKEDYGLDLMVEPVVDNHPLGNYFFIQSKGTTDGMVNGRITYSLSVERILDYSKVTSPVLLIYYSIKENKFWGRWMNAVYATLSPEKKRQKTIDLVFTSANEIDKEYLRGISASISVEMTSRTAVDVQMCSGQSARFQLQIESLCGTYLQNSISFIDPLSPHRIALTYQAGKKSIYAIARCDKLKFNVPLDGVFEPFVYLSNPTWSETPESARNVVLSLAFLAGNIEDYSKDFVLANSTATFMDLVPTTKWFDFMFSLDIKAKKDLSHILQLSKSSKTQEAKEAATLKMFFEYTLDAESTYPTFLQQFIENETNEESLGHLYYNLANSIRAKEPRRAAELYFHALKHLSAYKQCYYWWEETAGVLFMMQHYRYSEWFYKKARFLDDKNCRSDIALMIADTLLWQGKFEEAYAEMQNQEERNLNESSFSISLNLRLKVTEMLIKEADCSKFTAMDWFNKGITMSRQSNHSDAFRFFLYAWLYDTTDMEALINAFVSAFNCGGRDAKTVLVVGTMKEMYGISAYNELAKAIVGGNTNNDVACILDRLRDFFEDKDIIKSE